MTSRLRFLLAASIVLSLPVASRAQWVDGGLPVAWAAEQQIYPVIAPDGSGGAILAWQDSRGADFDIYVQRVNINGVRMWLPNGVALCTAVKDQSAPQIIPDGTGGAIVVWYDYRDGTDNNIYARRIDASGIPQWTANGVALCTATDDQTNAIMTSDGTGGAIIAWDDGRNGIDYNTYVQRINSSGVVLYAANGVAACAASGHQFVSSLVSNGAGAAIVTWYDYRTGFDSDIYAQRVNSSGGVSWAADGIALCAATGDQDSPSAVSDGSGGAIVAWTDQRIGATDVYAQHIAASGALLWVSDGIAVSNAANNQSYPTVASDAAGGAIISWQDTRNSASADIYAQRLNGSGAALWTNSGIPVCTASATQDHPVLVADGSGGANLVWADARNGNPDVYTQRINASGAALWAPDGEPVVDAPTKQASPTLMSVPGGGAIFAWQDFRDDTKGDIFVGRLSGSGYTPSTVNGMTPRLIAVGDNRPNPFSTATTFDITLQRESTVSAEVFDVAGHRVRTLDIGHVGAGTSQLQFDGLGDRATPLPSGVYFFRIRAAGETVTKKMVIAR